MNEDPTNVANYVNGMNGPSTNVNAPEVPIVRHRYSFKRFLRDVVPVLQAKERAGVSPYFFVFVHTGRKDFLDLWGPTDKVMIALREVAGDAIPLEELFTRVRLYRSSKDAHRNFIDPKLLGESFSNTAVNKSDDVLFRHKMYVFDQALHEREAAGKPSMSYNIQQYVLPNYLRKASRRHRRHGGSRRSHPKRKTRRHRK